MELETCLAAPDDWQRATIESVCAKFTSGGTPSRQRPEFYQGGVVPGVKTKELLDVVLEDAEEWITEEAIANSSAKRLPHNTVLMAMYGATVGQLGILGREMTCNQACAAMVANDAKCDYRFLYYLLLTNRRQIVSMATGAAQQNLSGMQIKNWTIALPDREEQRAISETLGALDERIANLRQTSTTLQAIAATLFKSRFVDFDGVPPEDMQESELGAIPKWWRVGTLADLCELNASKWTNKKHPPIVRYIDLSGISSNRIEAIAEYAFDDAPSRARMHLREGDTIVGTVRPGNRAFAYIHAPQDNLTGSTGFAVLSPKQSHYASFIFLAATRDEAIERLANLADGAAYPAVRPNVVAETPCVIAPDEVIAEFSDTTKPLLELIEQNSQQAATLAALRDTLLPRLISGQLRVHTAGVK
jgi:type I restriction enzyme S subunit